MVKVAKYKWIIILMAMSILVSLCTTNAYAMEKKDVLIDQYIETLGEESYVVVSVYQDVQKTRDGTINGHKDYSYYDGGLAWTFTVYGAFTSTGSCTAASYGVTIYKNEWYCAAGRAWPSGNSACASGTMRRGSDGAEMWPSVALYCTEDGVLY